MSDKETAPPPYEPVFGDPSFWPVLLSHVMGGSIRQLESAEKMIRAQVECRAPAPQLPNGENFAGFSVRDDEGDFICSLQSFMEDWVRRYGEAATPQVTPTWGWIVQQIHSHKPILDCPQCHATSERTAQTRCTGNEDNCPMDSGRNWLETILKLNIETIAAEFYGDPASEVTPCLGYPKCDGDLPGEKHEAECPAVEGTSEQAPQELELEQESDGRWIAEFNRFPGVIAYGPTKEEAIRNAAKVLIESEQASPTPDIKD